MCDRRLWQDAVSEIEEEGPLETRLEYVTDRAVQRGAAGEQHQRVEVPLHRHAPLDLITRKRRIDGPIEPDGIDRNIFHVAQECGADTTRKSDYLCPRYMAAHFRNDARRGINAPSLEFVRRQNAGPGIENLHRVRACLQLPDQIISRCVD